FGSFDPLCRLGLGAVLQPQRTVPVRDTVFLLVADFRHLPHRRLHRAGLSASGEARPMNVTIAVFLLLFVAVALVGLFGSRWRAGDLSQLHEWGLGGRSFGTLITWFLLGGDLYTAYTFIAVPALMFGAGAAGFFAVPYAALMYPVLFMAFPRLWSVANKHGYITAADFVRGRFGHRGLALAIAVTGLGAVEPYIALPLGGMA